jgi:hypothetical protein
MFRILCDPSSGSTELCLTGITRSESHIFCGVLGQCLAAYAPSTPQNICEPLRVIPVKHSSVLPDDGSHKIWNMSEWFLILCLLNILYLFVSLPTCFEQPSAHHQENWIVSIHHLVYVGYRFVCRSERNFPSCTRNDHDTGWHKPEVALIQLILLMKSTGLLEACRELK